MSKPLHLHEEILLLSLRDQEGTSVSTMYAFALGGALVSELILNERVHVLDDKQHSIELISGKSMGNELLDDCLGRIHGSKSNYSMTRWVQGFAHLHNLKHRIANELCKKGVLKQDIKKVLLLFKQRTYPEVDPEPEQEIKSRLEALLFEKDPVLDERTLVLASLAHSANLLKYNFDRDLLKAHKGRIESIAKGEMVGQATSQAIKNVQAAIMAATMVPVITAAIST